jgi:predicted Zn-dependent protease
MGVLGHEIGHVTARHTAQMQTQQMLGQIGLIGLMVASPRLAQFGEQLSQGMQLLFLKFGRDHESQSDQLGVDYSSKVGYDAKEMAKFFVTLRRISDKAGARIPAFLSTHPDPDDRFNKVGSMATAYQQKNPAQYIINTEGYLRRLENMIYGEDPKQGYVENNVFYHPEMKFQFGIPQGWKVQNSPHQVAMASADQKAMMIFAACAEKTLQEAAQAVVTNFKLKTIDQQNTTINGMQAMVVIADQVPQDAQTAQQAAANTVRVATLLVNFNGQIFRFHGVAAINDYPTYERTFGNSFKSFNTLTDPSKINVQPDRIHIRSLTYDMTLQEALKGFSVPQSRHEELAILNGMNLTDRLTRGTLIKIVSK